MERDLKSIQLDVNIGADSENISKMFLVFDANSPTEMFNGITQAVADLERVLKQNGILTEHGVGAGEMMDYVEYMKDVAQEAEIGIQGLYKIKDEVRLSDLVYKYALEDMIQDKIDEAWETVEKYYAMVDEVQIVEADIEFEATRPQTIIKKED